MQQLKRSGSFTLKETRSYQFGRRLKKKHAGFTLIEIEYSKYVYLFYT